MKQELLTGPVQVAYHVPDIRRVALDFSRGLGVGPFFVLERIKLSRASHRGQPSSFVHSSAYGQCGAVMVELVQQEDDGPSPFRDLYGPDETGIHHVAYFTAELEPAIAHLEANGMPLTTTAVTVSGQEFVFVDATARLGHMIELYEPTEGIRDFYRIVREAAVGWRGQDPVRSLS